MTGDHDHPQPAPPTSMSPKSTSTSGTEPDRPDPRSVDPRLLEFLVCPVTKTNLVYDRERSELVSLAAGLAFPIRDGVPMMTTETARELTDQDRGRLRNRR